MFLSHLLYEVEQIEPTVPLTGMPSVKLIHIAYINQGRDKEKLMIQCLLVCKYQNTQL